jgi:hypothetical protein
MGTATDTSAEAERVLLEVYRRMPLGQKWLQLGDMYRDARLLHAAGVRLRNPTATVLDVHHAWMTVNLDFPAPELLREPAMDLDRLNLREIRAVVRVLDHLGIPYAIGGSVASSLHGIDRYTRDADITVEPFPGKESQFLAAFGPDYYLSLSAIQDALRRRSCFNIINTSTGFKVDIFVRADHPFERAALQRRLVLSLPDAPEQPIAFCSAEDTLLFKLRWYRLGNESSQQQWQDVLNVLRVQAGKLDNSHLDHWAADLKVSDLLARARQESGV